MMHRIKNPALFGALALLATAGPALAEDARTDHQRR